MNTNNKISNLYACFCHKRSYITFHFKIVTNVLFFGCRPSRLQKYACPKTEIFENIVNASKRYIPQDEIFEIMKVLTIKHASNNKNLN